jgi:3,4-dihydroxy 2-butanone 4-phosphate synthase / GTP cyclohydrolase II
MTNKLAAWLDAYPKPMKKVDFARELGVTPSYVTQLCKKDAPWVTREMAIKIAEISRGAVTPNDLAGLPS